MFHKQFTGNLKGESSIQSEFTKDFFPHTLLQLLEAMIGSNNTKALLQGRNQVYAIRDHNPGIGIIDPGFRVTSHGIQIGHFLCVSLWDQGSSFSDTSLLMKNKNTSFCKEKDLLSGLLKKLKPSFIIF